MALDGKMKAMPPVLRTWQGTLMAAGVALVTGLFISFGVVYSITANILSLVLFGVALTLTLLASIQHKNTPKKDPRRR